MPSSGAGGGTGKSQASSLSTLSGRKTMSQALNQPNKVWHVFPYNLSQLFFYGVPVVPLPPLQIYFCHSSVKYLMIHVQQ